MMQCFTAIDTMRFETSDHELAEVEQNQTLQKLHLSAVAIK